MTGRRRVPPRPLNRSHAEEEPTSISINISRLAKAALAVFALGALLVPAAHAMTKDDWYNDANPPVIDQPRVVGDDWFNDAPAATPVALVTPDPVKTDPQPAPGGFDRGDFGIGAGSKVALLALLAMLAAAGRTMLRGGRSLGRT